jgi:hypothetical protein
MREVFEMVERDWRFSPSSPALLQVSTLGIPRSTWGEGSKRFGEVGSLHFIVRAGVSMISPAYFCETLSGFLGCA